MRLYTFVNYYLSPIQQGIQTAHIVSELFAYINNDSKSKMIDDWALDHKTIVVCNGGNADSLLNLINLFHDSQNPYPWIQFYEDEQSLNGALTAVGIILPEEIYDVKANKIEGLAYPIYTASTGHFYNEPDSYVYKLIDTIKSAPLAR